jgi:hypothetical protein
MKIIQFDPYKDSKLLMAYMKWKANEKLVMELIKVSMEYRETEKMLSLKATDLETFKTPLLQLHGRTKQGNRIFWMSVKYNEKKIYEDSKKATCYIFESIVRTETNKPVIFVY